ncbi:MAG: hypothetical protein K0S12_2016, partial [Bacteroidetes bacterium]|nr:hypothetical protein [Bacteroidota bacterium]
MKHLTLALVFCTIGVIHSQTFRYYKVGQKFTMDDNACLIIKKDLRLLLHIEDLEHYKEVKAVKLVGFRDHEFDMDSLMGYLSDYTKIKCLMFEDCDLNDLTEPLSNFTELRDLRILKKSSFYENFFFPLLKDNQIESLTFQKSEPDLVMDSLVLLRHLKTVSVGNNNTFVTPNKITNYQFGSKETLRTIPFAYYGTFLKNETITVRKPKEKKTNSDLKPRPMACIRQPIPGIKINDTLYSFNAATGTSASYKSGSVLTIDKNAFVKSDGQAYEGRVQLFYREFRNPVEIMLSGIPMTTKVNDQTMLFKSGGMYEISAYDASGNELKTKSDTSVKINFALTDTSQNFQFFSLNDNGSWTTTSPSVAVTSPNATGPVKNATKAVIEYYGYYYQRPAKRADTTDYNSRFLSKDYLYTYRKDNLEAGRDSVKYLETYATLLKKNGRIKSMFRIKYLKETKEKDILFTIVLAKNNLSYDVPAHVQSLLNKTYVYTGNLSKDEFRKTFSRKLLCWDFRPNTLGEEISLHIKTNRSFIDLKAKMVYTHRDGTYHIPRKANKILNN